MIPSSSTVMKPWSMDSAVFSSVSWSPKAVFSSSQSRWTAVSSDQGATSAASRPMRSATSRPLSPARISSVMPPRVWPRSSNSAIIRSRDRWDSPYQAIRPSLRGGWSSFRSR